MHAMPHPHLLLVCDICNLVSLCLHSVTATATCCSGQCMLLLDILSPA